MKEIINEYDLNLVDTVHRMQVEEAISWICSAKNAGTKVRNWIDSLSDDDYKDLVNDLGEYLGEEMYHWEYDFICDAMDVIMDNPDVFKPLHE